MRKYLILIFFIFATLLNGCGGCDSGSEKDDKGDKDSFVTVVEDNGCNCEEGEIISNVEIINIPAHVSESNVDEEIIFYANEFASLNYLNDPVHAKYQWDFGDSQTRTWNSKPVEGVSVTHSFRNPGNYTITLKVTEGELIPDPNPDAAPGATIWDYPEANSQSFIGTVEVKGEVSKLPPLVTTKPIFKLEFENNILNSGEEAVNPEWASGEGSYVQGIKGNALDLTGGKYLVINDATSVISNKEEITISFWGKKRAVDSFGYFMYQYDPQAQNKYGKGKRLEYYLLDAINSDQSHYGMYLRTNGVNDDVANCKKYTSNNESDTLWHHYAFTYSNKTQEGILYVDGKELSRDSSAGQTALSNVELFIGADSQGDNVFDGFIDEFKIYNRALSRDELFEGFEVWHAEFHGRIAQCIYVKLPGEVTADKTNKMISFVAGGDLAKPIILVNKTNLNSLENFKLVNTKFGGSQEKYIFGVQVISSTGEMLYEKYEKFYKKYAGAPKVGIDENNSIRINGKLFYPVTSWGLNNNSVDDWVNADYINTLYGQGFWGTSGPSIHSPAGWQDYLDIGHANGIKAIGPSRWDGQGDPDDHRFFKNNSDLNKLIDYVETSKNNPGMLMWQWVDEPMLYGPGANVLRSWTKQCHELDDQHLVAVNFMGHPFKHDSGYWRDRRHSYSYNYNKMQFGKKTPVTDVIGFDYYPSDMARTGNSEKTFYNLTKIIKNIQNDNYNLIPIFSFVETADASGQSKPEDNPSKWMPNGSQVKMIAWLNVVHGIKGINWFHYFGETPANVFEEMQKFTRQITDLTEVVLGPATSRKVTIKHSKLENDRIDIMIKENESHIYLFAVRLTEVVHQGTETTDSPEALNKDNINVSFEIEGISEKVVSVYDETRNININTDSGNKLKDSFSPFDVHIYVIPK